MALTAPFSRPLAGDGYVLDLRAEVSAPVRARPGTDHPRPAVLLVSRARDAEVSLIARRLEASGVHVARLDAETAASTHLVIDPRRGAVRIRGQWISPTVTWLRHFTHRAMPQGRGALRRAFAADSWQALADQLDAVSGAVIARREPGLLAQLATARAHGVAVPATTVTTDATQAAGLLPGSRLVIKALHSHFVEARPGQLHGLFPEVVDRGDLGRVRSGPPVVVQEYVDHDAELRVYHVDGRIAAAFAITKPGPSAPWLDPGSVSVRFVDPPAAVAAAASALAAAMSIDYGALDFLVAGGVPVFLEANFAGDWRWLETRVRSAPVTAAAVAMLASRHERLAGSAQARPGRVNLVTFLARGAGRTPVDKDERQL
jgi:hypothetical protein